MKNLQNMLKHVDSDVLVGPNGYKGYLTDNGEIPKDHNPQNQKKIQLYKFEIQKPKLYPPTVRIDEYEDGVEIFIDKYSDGYDLPSEYDELVNKAVFALPAKAVTTIKFLLNQAESHWDMPMYKGYDTCIRESFLSITKVMIEKAIMLLCDYHFDPETKYYSRVPEHLPKHVLRNLMIYKFWSGRTGRGLQWFNAGFSDYKEDDKFYHIAMEIDNQAILDGRRWDRYKPYRNGKQCLHGTTRSLKDGEQLEAGWVPTKKNNGNLVIGEVSIKATKGQPVTIDGPVEITGSLKINAEPDKEKSNVGEIEYAKIEGGKDGPTEIVPIKMKLKDKDPEPSYGNEGESIEVFEGDPPALLLFKVDVSYSDVHINNDNITTKGGGGEEYKVLAKTEQDAERIVKNHFYTKKFDDGQLVFERWPITSVSFDVENIPMPNYFEPKEEGIIDL